MAAQVALGAEHERRTGGIALFRLTLSIAHNGGMAARALPACVAWTHAAGDDPLMPRLVFGVPEDAPFHPEGPLAVATAAIPAFLWPKLREVFKHQDGRSLLFRESDNAAGNQVGKFLITGSDLAPESDVILLPLGDETGALAVACDASQLPLPKAGYLTSTSDETGGQDRTFGSLNGAHGKRPVEIQVDST
jgi:hypothetical protein